VNKKVDVNDKCPLTYAVRITGGKWKPIIIYRLYNGLNRFGILHRSIEGISKNMLTRELREMEANKILTRKIFAEIPPKVEYTLTKKGEGLIPVFDNLVNWAENFKK
jgi:DNA-binding HxlR family transcriptional regulator|tara:strand:+ start:455 stop:775 length:321 start_codon:yes stop_codon:yes gene_type:complete